MARSLNKVHLIGNLGQDPELRHTGQGVAVCNMRVATNEGFKDKSGNWQERTEWHTVVAWDKLAEICNEYLAKGRQVYIEGKLQTRQWDKDGETRYSTEIRATDVMFLSGDGPQSSPPPKKAPAKREKKAEPETTYDFEDDLPF